MFVFLLLLLLVLVLVLRNRVGWFPSGAWGLGLWERERGQAAGGGAESCTRMMKNEKSAFYVLRGSSLGGGAPSVCSNLATAIAMVVVIREVRSVFRR